MSSLTPWRAHCHYLGWLEGRCSRWSCVTRVRVYPDGHEHDFCWVHALRVLGWNPSAEITSGVDPRPTEAEWTPRRPWWRWWR